MFGGTPSPASRITTLLCCLASSLAIREPAKPDPTITTSMSSAMVQLPLRFWLWWVCRTCADEGDLLVRRTRPVAELHVAVAHWVRLSDAPQPALGIGLWRDDGVAELVLRVLRHCLQIAGIVPDAEVPHQHDAAREILGIIPLGFDGLDQLVDGGLGDDTGVSRRNLPV